MDNESMLDSLSAHPLTPSAFRAPHNFVFFTPSVSNQYNPICKFPNENAISRFADVRSVRKIAS
jgi:hypothetical protein